MSTSKLQRKFSQSLSVHFGQYVIRENSRPDWCLGDDFQRLELDLYLPELNVAVEVQGAQHYVFTPIFHATYDDFIAQQKRDAIKKQRCIDYGITLLEVDDDLSFQSAMERIREIEKVTLLRKGKSFTPQQWKHKIENLNTQAISLWGYKVNAPRPYLTGKVGSLKSKLHSFVDTYGMGVFEHAEPEVSQSLFWHVGKLIYWIQTH